MAPQDQNTQQAEKAPEKRRQVVKGRVVSDKMMKTRVIEVTRAKQHPLYHKRIVRQQRIFVHDENNESHVGDTVLAVSVRPLSRHKSFRLMKVLEKAVIR